MKIVRTKDVPWGEGMQRAISVSKGVDVTEYPDSGKVHAEASQLSEEDAASSARYPSMFRGPKI
jgi:hypothetical protein